MKILGCNTTFKGDFYTKKDDDSRIDFNELNHDKLDTVEGDKTFASYDKRLPHVKAKDIAAAVYLIQKGVSFRYVSNRDLQAKRKS